MQECTYESSMKQHDSYPQTHPKPVVGWAPSSTVSCHPTFKATLLFFTPPCGPIIEGEDDSPPSLGELGDILPLSPPWGSTDNEDDEGAWVDTPQHATLHAPLV